MHAEYYGHNGPLTLRQDKLARREAQVREVLNRLPPGADDDFYGEILYLLSDVRGWALEERDRLNGAEPGTWGWWELSVDQWLESPFVELLKIDLELDNWIRDYNDR